MASSAPWLHWTERDLGSGSREPKHWEEEEEEDFEEHMDENGVIGLEDKLAAVAGRPRSSCFTDALGRQILDPPAHTRSFSLGKLQEFGLEESGTDGEDARSPPLGDGEDPGDGTQEDLAYWHPREDVTVEDEEQGSLGDEERPEGTWGAESDGEAYPELSYEGQCGSECSGSPEVPQDGPALHGPYEKSLSFSTDGGETSVPSDISPGPSPPGRRASGGTSGSPSGGSPRQSPPTSSGHWSLSRSLLLHLSADDLRDAPRAG
nr:PREDICTED: uncharacterized protein LOC106495441 [Apteryx mantelli mantelli]